MTSRTWDRRVARISRGLFASLLLGILACAGAAWAADPANQLISVGVDDQAAAPTVLIKTAEPVGYRYTVYDSFDPVRVVIDFPGMDAAQVPEVTTIDAGVLEDIRVSEFDLASGSLARVEILLDEAAEYQVNLDGTDFRVTFTDQMPAAPATAEQAPAEEAAAPVETAAAAVTSTVEPGDGPPAKTLRDLVVSPGQAILDADGVIGKYNYFTLGNPPRLVLDVYGVRPAFEERTFPAGQGIKQVRIGTYNDKTRFVFDAAGATMPEHVVEKHVNDIEVAWGQSATQMVAAEPAAVAVAVEEAPASTTEIPDLPKAEPAQAAAVAPAAKEQPAAPRARTDAGPAEIKALDFLNEEGRSAVAVELSAPAEVSQPVQEGDLVRFEIKNVTIPRALRRTIDASAFPSAVTTVTPYTVTEGGTQNVRIAVDLKGPVAYALEKEGTSVQLVIDDGAYAEPKPPMVTQVEVSAPHQAMAEPAKAGSSARQVATAPRTADEMAAEAAKYTGEKISLVFDSADVRSILQLIGDVSGLNVLASSDVGGTITLRLIDVPWDQALDLVLETANLGKIQEGNVLRVMPMSKIREREQAAMKAKMEDIEVGALETRVFEISYSSVDDMKTFLTDLKSERGSIIADSRNKQLIVKDVASVLDQMEDMVARVDQPERQVLIEARIVEASTTFARDLGVKWNLSEANNPADDGLNSDTASIGIGGQFLVPVTNPAAAGLASSISFGALNGDINIDLRLSALETSGEGKIVSTPRVTTLNGEKAVISQGTKIPFSTVSDTGTDVTFENAELKLEVTPEINPDGSVILEINTSNSSVGNVVPTATGNAVSIDEKKAETKVLVRDGQTTVIGGIFVESEQDGASGVPWLKDIPVMGHLFKSTTRSRERRELLIFITPRILES